MQHLMTLRVYKHPTTDGVHCGVFRNEVTDDTRVMLFYERTRAMDYCRNQLAHAMSFMPFAKLHMKQVVRKGVWCYNVFGVDRNEAKRDAASLWALQGRKL